MPDVITLGEALIDFVSTESGVDVKDAPGFLKAAGGAPANVAVALSRLGVCAGFIGKLGDDPFGRFLAEVLEQNGVDTSAVRFSKEARTALAFVSLRADGERSFSFYRHPSADMLLAPEEIDEGYIASARIFHFGSISLICEPSRSATLKAIEYARKRRLLISYDPNLRLNLWESAEQARAQMRAALPLADVLKVNDEELQFLSGKRDLEEGCAALLGCGPTAIVVTLGAEGCLFSNGRETLSVPGVKVKAVDTTGAGDAFWAAVLWGLLEALRESRDPSALTVQEMRPILQRANLAGALTTTKKGAIPALPTLQDLRTP